MVTSLKVSKNLNSKTLEELISSLRTYEIELKKDASYKKGKFVSLKSKGKFENTKAFQAEEEESEEHFDGRTRCFYCSEELINSGSINRKSYEAKEEHVDILSHPLGRRSLEPKKK